MDSLIQIMLQPTIIKSPRLSSLSFLKLHALIWNIGLNNVVYLMVLESDYSEIVIGLSIESVK